MVTHKSIKQICDDHPKRLIRLFLYVLIHYTIRTAPVPSTYFCFDKRTNVAYKGLNNSRTTNFKTCIEECQQSRACNIVSIDNKAKWPCWFATTPLINERNFKNRRGTDTYVLDRACWMAGKCWKYFAETKYRHLTVNYETNIEFCLTYCKDYVSGCTAVSFTQDARKPCFNNNGTVDMDEFDSVDGTDSYILDRACMDPSFSERETANLTFKCWERRPGMLYTRTPIGTGILDLSQCIYMCEFVIRNCKVISFSHDTRWPCRMGAPNKVIESDFLDHPHSVSFVLDVACFRSMTTAGTITDAPPVTEDDSPGTEEDDPSAEDGTRMYPTGDPGSEGVSPDTNDTSPDIDDGPSDENDSSRASPGSTPETGLKNDSTAFPTLYCQIIYIALLAIPLLHAHTLHHQSFTSSGRWNQ